MQIAEAQVKTRQDEIILKPLKTQDEILEQEYSKGECSGIKLFIRMLPTMIESLDEEIAERLRKEEEENANSQNDDENASS